MQKATSKSTSINKDKLPAIYGKLDKLVAPDTYILDYGCGRFTGHLHAWAAAHDCILLPYDPFNQDDSTNTESWETALAVSAEGGRLIAICSNVLNVIDDDDAMETVLQNISRLSCPAYFTVYEGDKTGVGRYTGPDSYQRNDVLKDYLPATRKHFSTCSTKHGMMICW